MYFGGFADDQSDEGRQAMVSQAERDLRLAKLKDLIQKEGLSGAIVLGSGSFGPKENGHYRFFVDNRVYYFIQAFFMDREGEHVVICGSATHQEVLRTRNFRDIRLAGDRIPQVLGEVLTQKNISGTVGICEDQIPASWYQLLAEEFPRIRFRDISRQLYDLRREGDEERPRLAAEAARLAETGYDALCRCLEESRSLPVLRGEMEYAMKVRGAEEVLTLFSVPGAAGRKPLSGDAVLSGAGALCVTAAPRVDGYWAPVCRTVFLTPADPDARALHRIAGQALAAGAEKLISGGMLREAAVQMGRSLQQSGCRENSSYGKVCGVDLYEAAVSKDTEERLRSGMTVFLKVETGFDTGSPGLCWGQTYLVTPQGGRLLWEGDERLREVMPNA